MINVDVSPREQTVWLDERQISELFDTTRQAINYHINNILDEEEMGDRCCKEILRDIRFNIKKGVNRKMQ